MQLVAYGAQDIYLTGNPQITFFKVVYRRHTNFSMEAIEQTISGNDTLSTSTTSGTVTISRNGDLVHKVYVVSESTGITNGSELVSDVELEIGGQRIDRQYSEWMKVWKELSTPESKALGLKSMQGDFGSSGTTGTGLVQVPLSFYFCQNAGLALPLIALQYHEVKINLELSPIQQCLFAVKKLGGCFDVALAPFLNRVHAVFKVIGGMLKTHADGQEQVKVDPAGPLFDDGLFIGVVAKQLGRVRVMFFEVATNRRGFADAGAVVQF